MLLQSKEVEARYVGFCVFESSLHVVGGYLLLVLDLNEGIIEISYSGAMSSLTEGVIDIVSQPRFTTSIESI
jgi:hypothetical protein